MLAQNFKSADELGLDKQEKEALVKTLALLETGKLIHTPFFVHTLDGENTFTGHFNMAEWNTVAECGTVACIGGTAELIGNLEVDQLMNKADNGNEELSELFYPSIIGAECRYTWRHIKPAQAARALRSYLTTGKANWISAVA